MKKKIAEARALEQKNSSPLYGQIDERTKTIANAGDAFAFRIVLFILLFDVCYRSFMLKDPAWDIMGIVIGGGLISTVYQIRFKIFKSNGFLLKYAFLIAILSALIAIVLVKFVKG